MEALRKALKDLEDEEERINATLKGLADAKKKPKSSDKVKITAVGGNALEIDPDGEIVLFKIDPVAETVVSKIDPDAEVVLSPELPTIDEYEEEEEDEYDTFDCDQPESIVQQKGENSETGHDDWYKMKEKYDQILADGHLTSQTDTVLEMSDMIVQNGYYLCLGGAFLTPGEFYVNPLQTWNSLEGMMERMQKEYEIIAKDEGNPVVPWKGHLIPGFVVAARFHSTLEFHRARILCILTGDRYQVQFLDYGDILIIQMQDIRYLPLKFLQTMEFQAIRCTLQFEITPPWTYEEGEFFRNLIFDKVLAIRFKQDYEIEGEGIAWEVDVHVYNERTKKITDFHVEHQIFQNGGRDFIKDDTDTPKANVEIFKFKP